jgi:hypothetical protein
MRHITLIIAVVALALAAPAIADNVAIPTGETARARVSHMPSCNPLPSKQLRQRAGPERTARESLWARSPSQMTA